MPPFKVMGNIVAFGSYVRFRLFGDSTARIPVDITYSCPEDARK